MSFGYTEAEKRQMLCEIRNKEGTINGLEAQKAAAKARKDEKSCYSYDLEISRLKNQIEGLKAYLR